LVKDPAREMAIAGGKETALASVTPSPNLNPLNVQNFARPVSIGAEKRKSQGRRHKKGPKRGFAKAR